MSELVFAHVDIQQWVQGCINRVDGLPDWKERWNQAWYDSYRDAGGLSKHSGKKGCPRSCVKTLYEFGRLQNTALEYQARSRAQILQLARTNGYKNGAYGLMAQELLIQNPEQYSNSKELSHCVYASLSDLGAGISADKKDPGSIHFAYALHRLNMLRYS